MYVSAFVVLLSAVCLQVECFGGVGGGPHGGGVHVGVRVQAGTGRNPAVLGQFGGTEEASVVVGTSVGGGAKHTGVAVGTSVGGGAGHSGILMATSLGGGAGHSGVVMSTSLGGGAGHSGVVMGTSLDGGAGVAVMGTSHGGDPGVNADSLHGKEPLLANVEHGGTSARQRGKMLWGEGPGQRRRGNNRRSRDDRR